MLKRLATWWGRLSSTEKMFIGMIIFLIVMIIARWNFISKEVAEGFEKIFSKRSDI